MKLTIALVVAALIITAAVVVSSTPDQTAEAKSVRKVHFTETVQSSSDPGKGNKGQQMAVLLSPNPGTIYVGTVTYTDFLLQQLQIPWRLPRRFHAFLHLSAQLW